MSHGQAPPPGAAPLSRGALVLPMVPWFNGRVTLRGAGQRVTHKGDSTLSYGVAAGVQEELHELVTGVDQGAGFGVGFAERLALDRLNV